MTVPSKVVLVNMNISFISKMFSSKPKKHCIIDWFKKRKKEKDKKIEEEPYYFILREI